MRMGLYGPMRWWRGRATTVIRVSSWMRWVWCERREKSVRRQRKTRRFNRDDDLSGGGEADAEIFRLDSAFRSDICDAAHRRQCSTRGFQGRRDFGGGGGARVRV